MVEIKSFQEDIEKLKRAASVVQAPDMVLEKTDNGCALTVCDKKNNTANNYAIDVDCSSNAKSFKFFFKVENMKLLLLSATPMYNSYKEIIWLLNFSKSSSFILEFPSNLTKFIVGFSFKIIFKVFSEYEMKIFVLHMFLL
mgnify:CR=1 FL=1